MFYFLLKKRLLRWPGSNLESYNYESQIVALSHLFYDIQIQM